MNFKVYATVLFISLSLLSVAQETENIDITTVKPSKKGKFFVSWGGNREVYSKSDIRFQGDNYDFTMYNVKAHDKPKGWHIDYINPSRVTIPQTNFRMGYYFKNNWLVTLGLDHMKYVVTQPQLVNIDGTVNIQNGEGNTDFNGTYNDSYLLLDGALNDENDYEFFEFEHTDGLNFIFAEVARVDEIGQYFKLNPNTIQVNLLEGIGAGGLYPKTNATIFGKPRNDEFHWSGYGLSAKVGLNVILFNHFQIQSDVKGGYINMPWIKTTANGDTATQSFWFFQHNITFGYVFQLFNKKK